MSANVRVSRARDGENAWPHRRELLARTIRDARPDAIGTQELTLEQAEFLTSQLPEYEWVGRDRRGGHDDEHMGILWNSDRLELLEAGDFWLSDTPSEPGSMTWGNIMPRMVTWARFAEVEASDGGDGSTEFVLANTHFPYRPEDEATRVRCARLIVERLAELEPSGTPVALTGDFNTGPESEAYRVLTEALGDVAVDAGGGQPSGTFHGFTGVPGERIDWIMQRGFTPLSFETVTAHDGIRYPSDHFLLLAGLAH